MDSDDVMHVLSLSGGKDSTAAALWLREQGIPHVLLFMDTGWEHTSLYDHLDYLEAELGPIVRIQSDIGVPDGYADEVADLEQRIGRKSPMIRWCVKKAMFPSRVRRWCTQELKVRPFLRWVDEQDSDIVNIVGIRAEESAARSELPEREPMPGAAHVEVWRPLIRWTEQDVIDIHTRHSVRPCRLYLEGASRVGCWPCIMARKAELRMLGDEDVRVSIIRDLEALVARVVQDRKHRHENPPTFYQSRAPNEDGVYPCVPIDKVLEWARTGQGGRQYELFAAAPRDAGCTRWGLCDTGGSDA
jgi:3'-phosphoadenosine 5'-phosphosulfate sulfotransferase (PAPS reductase)/FAD synthetase